MRDERFAETTAGGFPISTNRRFYREAGPVKRTRVNDMIRLSPIRLIDEHNQQVGVVETPEALRMAREAGLDLVEIQPDVRPPVCKIMDYGKFKYDLSKKEQKSRQASKGSELKEVRLGRSVKIDPHDVEIRVNQARKFLMDGHKVLIVQRFRGREMMHRRLGEDRLREIQDALADIAKVEVPPRAAGRQITMILAPDRQRVEAAKRREKKVKDESARKGGAAADSRPAKLPDPADEVEEREPQEAEA